MRPLVKCAGILMSLILVSQTLPAMAEQDPPSYNASRYLEDYRYLKNSARRTDFWDRLKYISLNDTGSVYLSFGGETRQHYESIRNKTGVQRSRTTTAGTCNVIYCTPTSIWERGSACSRRFKAASKPGDQQGRAAWTRTGWTFINCFWIFHLFPQIIKI